MLRRSLSPTLRRLFCGNFVLGHKGHGYDELLDRLNENVLEMGKGEPLVEGLHRILSEEQAGFLSKIPLGFVSFQDCYSLFEEKYSSNEVDEILKDLFELGFLFENVEGECFHFPGMKDRNAELPVPELARLFDDYLMDHWTPSFADLDVTIGVARTAISNEEVVDETSQVLDYESARKIITNATTIAVGNCTCRSIWNENYPDAPLDLPVRCCLGFDQEGGSEDFASTLIRHDILEEATVEEALSILSECEESGLVCNVDNAKTPTYMCHCDRDACYLMRNYIQDINSPIIQPSRFIPVTDHSKCTNCMKCVDACPLSHRSYDKDLGIVDLCIPTDAPASLRHKEQCIGCGICANFCDPKAITMVERENYDLIIPEDTLQKQIFIAQEIGMLHAIVFGDQNKKSHRILKPIAGKIEQSAIGKTISGRWTAKLVDWAARKIKASKES